MEFRLDVNCLMAERIGKRGIERQQVDSLRNKALLARNRLLALDSGPQTKRIEAGEEWLALPNQDKALIRKIVEAGEAFAESFEDVIVLGIGGSKLGADMLMKALASPHYNEFPLARKNRSRVHFEGDNLSPDSLHSLLENCTPSRTGVIVISKSGETTETKAAFLILKDWLRKGVGRLGDHIVAITDPAKGELRKEVTAEGYTSFEAPEGVGGRFSVLSPVGLVPAAVLGIEIEALLGGAAQAKKACLKEDLWQNPALLMAALQYLYYTERGVNIEMMMPFDGQLFGLSRWYQQLLAESLGKKHDLAGKVVNVGRTPVALVGTSDLHSVHQLDAEGPYDKTVTFVTVNNFAGDLVINDPRNSFLHGKKMSEAQKAARLGTEFSLSVEGRPSANYIIERRDAEHLGALLMTMMFAVTYEGNLLDVNSKDQPGVEGYKRAMYAQLGKPGFEEIAKQLQAVPADPRYVLKI
jgi:glucose-6-phosphate isomerase